MNSRVFPEPPLSTTHGPSPLSLLGGLDQIGLTRGLLASFDAYRASDGRLRSVSRSEARLASQKGVQLVSPKWTRLSTQAPRSSSKIRRAPARVIGPARR